MINAIKVHKIDGIIGDIWHGVLEKSLNFTTEIRPSKDRHFGAQTWNSKVQYGTQQENNT